MRHRYISDVMTSEVITIESTTPIKQALRVMHDHDVNALPVVDDAQHPVGMLARADLVAKQGTRQRPRSWLSRMWAGRDRSRLRANVAADLMTTPVRSITADAGVRDAARLADRYRVNQFPVITPAGAITGIVSRIDLLRLLLRPDEDIAADVVHEVLEHTMGMVVTPGTVRVDVHDGVVTLRGTVQTSSMIPAIESLTREIDGVIDVDAMLEFLRDDQHHKVAEPLITDLNREPWLNP